MYEPRFAQAERRPLIAPMLLAVVVLAASAFFVSRRLLPVSSVRVTLLSTKLLPVTTEFKSDSTVIGFRETTQVLFVVVRVRVENGHRIPVTFDDAHLVLTNAAGEEARATATYQDRLPNLETMYPRLKPLAGALLSQGTVIQPAQVSEGNLLFALNVPEEMWKNRNSAVVSAEIYNEAPIMVTIPKS